MKFNPDIHRRRSLRLKTYDYATPGMYFVTVVAQNRECLFGDIMQGKAVLNDAGCMVQSIWDEMPSYYPGVDLDARVVMPNHIHGIIVLNVGAGPSACPDLKEGHTTLEGHPQGRAPTMSLPDVVHRFKSLVTERYRQSVVQKGWPPFYGRLWQRNYYEHIIRSEEELQSIREYIVDNPLKWDLDKENPAVTGQDQ